MSATGPVLQELESIQKVLLDLLPPTALNYSVGTDFLPIKGPGEFWHFNDKLF